MVFISNHQLSGMSVSQAVQTIICQLAYVLNHELSSTWHSHTNNISSNGVVITPLQEGPATLSPVIHHRYNGAPTAKCPSPYGDDGTNHGTIVEREVQFIITTLLITMQLGGLRGTTAATITNTNIFTNYHLPSILQLLHLCNTGNNNNNEETTRMYTSIMEYINYYGYEELCLQENQKQQLLLLLQTITQSIRFIKQNGGDCGSSGSNNNNNNTAAAKLNIISHINTNEHDPHFNYAFKDGKEERRSTNDEHRSSRQTVRPLWRVPCVTLSHYPCSSLWGHVSYQCYDHQHYHCRINARAIYTSVSCV
jgi:hypothetical protein